MSIKRILVLAANAAVIGTAEALTRAMKVGQVGVIDSSTVQTDQVRDTVRIFESKPVAPYYTASFRKSKGEKKRAAAALRAKGWK